MYLSLYCQIFALFALLQLVRGACVQGEERCVKECTCGYGYEVCVGNSWKLVPIPSIFYT